AKGSVKSLIRGSQRRCALEKLSKFLRRGSHLSKVRMGGSQNRVNIGEFRISAGCFRREFHRLCVPLRQQGRPACCSSTGFRSSHSDASSEIASPIAISVSADGWPESPCA